MFQLQINLPKKFFILSTMFKKNFKKRKKFYFLIIGEGQDRKKIEGYIERFRLSNYIILTGYKKIYLSMYLIQRV